MSKRFLSSALALALCFFIFAGCGEEAVDDSFSPEDYTEDYFDPHEALQDRTEYTPVPRDVLDKTFTLTEAQATAVTDTISSIKVDYANSQMYNLQACMDAYNKLSHTPAPPSHEIIQNGRVEYDTLLQSVLENNSHKEDIGYYGELPQKEVEKVVKLVVETINYNLPRNPYIDQNILDHKLKALKIRTFSDFGYGVYTYSDNVIALNTPAIEDAVKNNYGSFEDIVCHEANHILQDAAVVRDDALEMNYGFCYQFSDLEVNTLYWLWLVEGAAQNSVLLQRDMTFEEATSYSSYVSALNSLIATYAFDRENVYALQHITAQTDLNKLFDTLSCTTEAEKEEVLNMMVAYALFYSETDTILSSPLYTKMGVDDTYRFGKGLRSSLGQTQSKLFYKNLARKLQKETVSLEGLFGLLAYYEIWLAHHAWYASAEQANYMKQFYSAYETAQNSLFREISAALNMNEAELHKYYTDYFHTAQLENFQNPMLTPEQNAFYHRIYIESATSHSYTVKEVSGVMPK